MKRPVLFMVDEGQELFQQQDAGSKILMLRQHGIVLVVNFQNASQCPIEIRGNATLLAFQLTDKADRDVFGSAAGLATPAQREALSRLDRQQCICFLPQSRWKSPFLASVPEIAFSRCDVDVREQSRWFTSRFDWKPIEEGTEKDAVRGGSMDEATERFLRDVLNQVHEASSLTSRFERAGIRSADKQGKIIRKLCSEGYIKVWSLAVGRGRPLKLVEPTDNAFSEFGVKWKKSRGALPTRVATNLLEKKFAELTGWTCVREGELSYEDDQAG